MVREDEAFFASPALTYYYTARIGFISFLPMSPKTFVSKG